MTESNLLFTPSGFKKMRERADALEQQIRDLESQLSSAAETGGNQWHDNFSYEQLTQQIRMHSQRLCELHRELRQARIIAPSSDDTVGIGKRVIICFVGDDPETWTIVGHGESNPDRNLIAYNTPLAALLIGKKTGEKASGEIGGRRVEIEVIEVKPAVV